MPQIHWYCPTCNEISELQLLLMRITPPVLKVQRIQAGAVLLNQDRMPKMLQYRTSLNVEHFRLRALCNCILRDAKCAQVPGGDGEPLISCKASDTMAGELLSLLISPTIT